MPRGRSTPPSPGLTEYTHFARMPSSFARDRNALPTVMERFAMGRSNSSFNAIAGAVGGVASGIVSCPLDVIKTKLQAQGGFRSHTSPSGTSGSVVYKGMLGTARVIWRDEGFRGMYRGLGPLILGYLPTWAVWFTVYGKSKDYLSRNNSMHLIMRLGWIKLTQNRQSTCGQFLVVNSCWRFLHHSHKPDLGHQDSINDTK
jgi:solute carrier family 25 (mitochondrial folate transporter), member 32